RPQASGLLRHAERAVTFRMNGSRYDLTAATLRIGLRFRTELAVTAGHIGVWRVGHVLCGLSLWTLRVRQAGGIHARAALSVRDITVRPLVAAAAAGAE